MSLFLRTIAVAAALSGPALAQTAGEAQPAPGAGLSVPGDAEALRSERITEIFKEVRGMLADAADHRSAARDGEGNLVADSLFGSRADRADRLLGQALEVVTDMPVVEVQREIAAARVRIEELKDEIIVLREDRIAAPENTDLWQSLSGTQDRAGIEAEIAERRDEIIAEEGRIAAAKTRFREAMRAAGTAITPQQTDLLLDSVTGDDIIRIAAAYDVAKSIGAQLLQALEESGEELSAARRYYAMHTTLIALLAHAQERFIAKVDTDYLPRLEEIERDMRDTRLETDLLLRDDPTPEQRRVLEANRASQDVTGEAAALYRDYLMRQRDEVSAAHARTIRELRVADNTLRTVDASFRLREIMEGATLEFETLQTLQSPGFETIFENRELREKFDELSDRLRAPGS